MIHLYCLLLHLQLRYLFICSFHFHLLLFFIFISYSSLNRSSTVNVVLTFNDSLILLAPSAPILFPVHSWLRYITLLFPSPLSSLSQPISRFVQGATGITLSISSHSFSIIHQCHSPHSASFFSVLQTSYFHLSTSSFPLLPFLHKNLSNLIPCFL